MTIEELNENNFKKKKTFPSILHLPSWPTRKKIKEKNLLKATLHPLPLLPLFPTMTNTYSNKYGLLYLGTKGTFCIFK